MSNNDTDHLNTRYAAEGAVILTLIDILINTTENMNPDIHRAEAIRCLKMSYAAITKIV